MSGVVNYIRKKITRASKKDKLKQKDEMLTSQAEKIAKLTADLSQSQQVNAELLRVRDSQTEEIVQLKVEVRADSLSKEYLEERIRLLELAAARDAPLQETIHNLQDKIDEMRQENWGLKQYTHQVEHCLSNCNNTIHQLRQQKNANVLTIKKLKVQVADLEESSRNTPNPKPIGTPTCQICLNEFNETRRIPRMLACGHTLCEPCILQIREGPTLKCPFDRKEKFMGAYGVAGLPKNFSILEVMEEKKKENTPIGKPNSESAKGGKRRKTFVADNH